jgi:MerR family redox-sensitive transcriptional activator SoxR
VLTIGQAGARTGLRASAIRYYESRGLLPKAFRKGGKRMYDASVLERLAAIDLAKTAGFSLDEIRAAFDAIGRGRPTPIWQTLVSAKRVELDAQIATLKRMKDVLARISGCTCQSLDECGARFTDALSRQRPDGSR